MAARSLDTAAKHGPLKLNESVFFVFSQWKDYYFVLDGTTLAYSIDSKVCCCLS